MEAAMKKQCLSAMAIWMMLTPAALSAQMVTETTGQTTMETPMTGMISPGITEIFRLCAKPDKMKQEVRPCRSK
jgi:hypothetical protein